MPAYDMNPNATVRTVPLDRKKILKKTIEMGVGVILIFGFIGWFLAAIFFGWLAGFLGAIVLALLMLAPVYWYQTLYYEKYYYDLKEDSIVIRKGVWMPKELSVSFTKIQDVYIDQDLFDRIFGIFDVHLSTATFESGMHAHIDGLDEKNATQMKGMLIEKVKKYSRAGKSGL